VLVKRVLFLLNAALAIAILHLISQVRLPSTTAPKKKGTPRTEHDLLWVYRDVI